MTANNTPDPNEKVNPAEPIFTVMKNKDPCEGGQTCSGPRMWEVSYASHGECMIDVMVGMMLTQEEANSFCCNCA